MIDILVLFHSVSEHAWRLAEAVAEGAAGVEGCAARLRQVPKIADLSDAHGGGPFGVATLTCAPGDRSSDVERTIVRAQGRALAEVARAWAGRAES